MDTILFYGTDRDAETETTIFNAITSSGLSTLYFSDESVSLIPPGAENPDFLMIQLSKVPTILTGKGVVVFKQDLPFMAKPREIPGDFIAVVDPANEEAIAMLKKCRIQTVTCGMSSKDTLTFSSLDTESAVVSLQRELKTLQGDPVLPREIPVTLSSPISSGYPLLAAAAILIICGKLPEKIMCR